MKGRDLLEKEEGIVRLSKPIKKGLLRLVFSRFFVIALLAVMQIAILVSAYVYFTDKLPILINLMRLFSLAMVVYLFNCKMDSSAKLTWMFIIAILPLAGAAFLLFTQSNFGHRLECRLVDEQIQTSREFLKQPENVLEKLAHDGSGVDDLCHYLNRSGCFPLFEHTAVRYFPLGEDMFEAMLEELEKAEKFIFLEYFIIQEGYMWGRAFTGGVNLADEYINRIERFGHWKDTAVMLKGPAVKSFTLMFLQMWYVGNKEPDYESFLGETEEVPEAKGYVMPYCDSPLDGEKVGESVYIDLLNRATDYVHIMSPYLILDGELENAMRFAAERGVDVKLILPGIPDKKVAYALAKTHYRSLTESGVKIFEYTPGFDHAKVFVSDDTKAVVGTINLDYRSLYHHFECAAYLYRTECIPEIEKDYLETLAKCRRVTDETIRKEKITTKLIGQTVKFMSPLM